LSELKLTSLVLVNVAEFDNWYAESFLNQADKPQTSVAAGHGVRPGIFIPYNPNAMVSLGPYYFSHIL